MLKDLEKIINEARSALARVKNLEELSNLEIIYLGRKGKLTNFLRQLVNLSVSEKRVVGEAANRAKKELEESFRQLKTKLGENKKLDKFIDPTLPGEKMPLGHFHPITLILDELEELFLSLGFVVLDGPELESDYFNFTALNIPPYHPARDMQDTFYVVKTGEEKKEADKRNFVMRTHTSPMQIRAMRKYGAPLRAVVPGRVFRNEATDAVHETTFFQLEGIMVDKEVSVANLIAVMKEMMTGFFKQVVQIRVRPGYFPFTEPSLEVDIKCLICGGAGCPSCKNTGWLEMIGAGMIHPQVLSYGGLDPEKFSGFAFGLGVTRLAMMKYGVEDIRLFNSGDLRFLEQF